MALIIILEVSATVDVEGLIGDVRDEPDEGGRVIDD